jgi:hypothetical protein
MLVAKVGTPRSFLFSGNRRVVQIWKLPIAWYRDPECKAASRTIVAGLVSLVLLVGFDTTGSWAWYAAIVLNVSTLLGALYWLYRRLTHPMREPIIPAFTKFGVNRKMQGVSS